LVIAMGSSSISIMEAWELREPAMAATALQPTFLKLTTTA
jgi:hypothetical protein